MEELIARCRDADFREMIAIIACEPEAELLYAPSVALHESLGFLYAGRLRSVGYKHGKWLDTILMQLSL